MLKLPDSEYKFMSLVWENEPIKSKELTIVCEKELGWKRTTTYTILKKLSTKGFVKNENTIVSSIVNRQQVQQYESYEIVKERFDGSLAGFITSFSNSKKLSQDELKALQELIDSYEEDC